jgi:hypothetical protein
MDRLDQVIQAAGPLLRRVDEVLSTVGAPPEHPVWAELRRVHLLPGDAAYAVAALRPAELTEAAPELRGDARAYAGIAESLPAPTGWTGDAADAYDNARRRAADHLSGSLDSLDERLEATADLADALIEWMDQSRAELAAILAEILNSAEALDLSSDSAVDPAAGQEMRAAADIAARVLASVADSCDLATELLDGSADLANVQPQRA